MTGYDGTEMDDDAEGAPGFAVVHDPGGLGYRITELWAWLAVHEDGDEGVSAASLGGVMMPLLGADRARVESLRPYAEMSARATGKRVVLARFDVRTDVEVIEP